MEGGGRLPRGTMMDGQPRRLKEDVGSKGKYPLNYRV